MNRRIFLVVAFAILLGTGFCVSRFGLGETVDHSGYKSVTVLEDGRTLLFTYTLRKQKIERRSLGWDHRVIHLRDIKYFCSHDLVSGETRILLELRNKLDGMPHQDLTVLPAQGNTALVIGSKKRTDFHTRKNRAFLFDGDRFRVDPKSALVELEDLKRGPDRRTWLASESGVVVVQDARGDGTYDVSLRRRGGAMNAIGRSKGLANVPWKNGVCFRDAGSDEWVAVDADTGERRILETEPASSLSALPDAKVRASLQSGENPSSIVVQRVQVDGTVAEEVITPHEGLLR